MAAGKHDSGVGRRGFQKLPAIGNRHLPVQSITDSGFDLRPPETPLTISGFLGVNLLIEVHDMNRTVKVIPVLMVLAGGVVFTAAYRLSAQEAAAPAAA